jgi:hypothetical protein
VKDANLLKDIQKFFGGIGNLRTKKNVAMFSVTAIDQIHNNILPHFMYYPLQTKKQADFLLFLKAANLMKSGLHLTQTGLQEIVNIRASMN